jgi:hypothetical protein
VLAINTAHYKQNEVSDTGAFMMISMDNSFTA